MERLVSRGWYFGVICSSCGLPIYCLEDKNQGKRPVRFSEPGILRIACTGCSEEDLYTTGDVQLLRAP